MILLTILLLIIAFLTVASIVVISATGAVGIILFGDVIVCIWLLIWIIKKLNKKKKK